jgi:hypothetical protein
MATKKEILDRLAAGEISASDAAQLLNQPEETAEAPAPTPTPAPAPQPATVPQKAASNGEAPAWFRVRVADLKTGRDKVSVNIPLGVLKLGLRIGSRFAPELKGLDWQEIESMVQEMQTGLLVEVKDEEDGEHVRVFIE